MNETSSNLSQLGEKIFYDRYALKEVDRSKIRTGDVVLVSQNAGYNQKELGNVQLVTGDKVTVKLRDGEILEKLLSEIEKPKEVSVDDVMERVAKGAAAAEKPDVRNYWHGQFRWLLSSWKFVPGGRILAACGTEQNLTYYNCFVVPSPVDSREGIIGTLSKMSEIMSRGGGVGINISTLRPRNCYVKGVNGRSSGSVSWGALYSFATGLIEQGGSRRGALMLILNVWHPDILEFIDSKREAGKIENANISVGITDDFMAAVRADDEWELIFPDTTDPKFESQWSGNINRWKEAGGKVTVQKKVKARDLWQRIIDSAWASAEPGVWFVDSTAKMSNSWYYPEGELICTNPCGEQPLPGWSVCNLGHINLSQFVKDESVDFDKLSKSVRTAVRFLDNIIDSSPYFFDENKQQQHAERRVGLGTIGLAEMLIMLKVRYGSAESLEVIDELYQFIANEAYEASAELAKEKGVFPKFKKEEYLKSGFVASLPDYVREKIAQNGMRNVTLLTQAPTGTVGTMIGSSTGIEPFYSWSYFRKSRLGTHEEKVRVVEEWEKAHPGEALPDYFVSALELQPEEHVRVQGAIQRWVDSAISKTCNVPSHYTKDQVRELYELMYETGCKGGTIYRDASRSEQVLMAKAPQSVLKANEKGSSEPSQENSVPTLFDKPEPVKTVRDRPYRRHGVTLSKVTPSGTAHITMNRDDYDSPFEVFLEIGKAGSDIKAMAEAMGRLCSLVLRVCSPLSPTARVQEIVDQLSGIGGPKSFGFGKKRVRSLPDALAQALAEEFLNTTADSQTPHAEVMSSLVKKDKSTLADLCPECGDASFQLIEGCQTCSSCGHSEC